MPVIPAADCIHWRETLSPFGEIDATYLPEYHLAYALRIPNSTPLLWHYSEGANRFIYPFLLTQVHLNGEATGYHDISGIYGYTGPLATTAAPKFLTAAWRAFDAYTEENNIIAEFVRFSPFNENQHFAHPGTDVSANRTLAYSYLTTEAELLEKLGPKTRNMLKKAERFGLASRELALPEYLPAFRALYDQTMARNNAPQFFLYDDAYYNHLLQLGSGLRLFGVYAGETLVAAAMSVSHATSGLYHLGASIPDYARHGAGNLSLFEMSRGLLQSGVRAVNMTGGRTTALDDPLLLFKKSNATSTATFYIGKRIVNKKAYQHITEAWQTVTGTAPDPQKIIFWRH